MIWLVIVVVLTVVLLTVRQYHIRSKKMEAIDSAASMLRNDVLEIQRLAASMTQPKVVEGSVPLATEEDDSYSVATHDARTAVENVLRFSLPTEYLREISAKDLSSNISLICHNQVFSEYYAELLEDASYIARKNSVSVVDDDFWDAAFWSSDRSPRTRGFPRQSGKRKAGRSFDHGESNLGGYVFG